MSLIKQLWLAILAILLLALGGSFAISMMSAKAYLEAQLHLKNIDNATVLALSITQMEKDPVTLELLISAQFDSGHYQHIALVDPGNQVMIERHYEGDTTPAIPAWFTHLVSLDAPPGVAQVQDAGSSTARSSLKAIPVLPGRHSGREPLIYCNGFYSSPWVAA